MTENNSKNGSKFLFKPVQRLGIPTVFPPPAQGKLPVAVQFIIPGLKLGNKDKKSITKLAQICGMEIWGVDMSRAQHEWTKEPATLATFAFYVSGESSEVESMEIIASTSRLLVERFLGLLSFFTGSKLSFVHLQFTTTGKEGQYTLHLPMRRRSSTPPMRIEFPSDIDRLSPSDATFSALFWLRRGLAERDPIETFSSLMVSLQIMARQLVVQEPVVRYCKSCGNKYDSQEPSITSLMRELVVSRLGASTQLFNRLWKARNAVVAHGNKTITAEVVLELTDLKFDAAILAFKGIKLGLGMPLDMPPLPNQSFFITDAFMYLD